MDFTKACKTLPPQELEGISTILFLQGAGLLTLASFPTGAGTGYRSRLDVRKT